MYIQYVGFNVAASSRVYNFDVIDTAEAREFTVKVQSQAFRPAALKLQDGPDICYARLKQELEGETQESRAEAHLDIGERDIEEYLEQRSRRQPVTRKKPRTGDGGAE
jgi:hypothetical protein